jgi:antitoxin component HigA of HigAB toxin-antitoxin module
MLQKKANKNSNTNQEASARKITSSRSHSRRDEHVNDRKSNSMNRCHHYLEEYTRRAHASSGPGSNPSVSHVRRQKRRTTRDILQGVIRKIKSPNFNVENRKGEEVEERLLEINKYF